MANARSKSLHRGHIEKRGETSRRIVIGLGKKEDGTYRIHRETITAPTAAEADERARVRLTEILYQHDKGKFIVSGKMNYGDFLDYWLENYVKIHLEESTYEAYERHVRKRIKRVLGSYDLTQLNPLIINEFYAKLQQGGARLDGKEGPLSAATVHRVHAVVHGSLQRAVEWYLLTHNPADGVKLPDAKQKPKRVWDEDKLIRFLQFIPEHTSHQNYAFILTLAYTAMRVSEVCALRWPQIDWRKELIDVDRSLKRSGKNWRDGNTKSKKRREIPLDPMLAEILREHRTNQNKIRQDMGPDWNPQHLVFTTQNGTPINRSNFYNRVWKPLHDEFNASLCFGDDPLPYLNIHGLRHTFGTIFVRAGGDAKMGAEIFGHHSTAFFQDQYVHPNVEDKRRELSKFSSRLRRVSG